MKNKYNQLELIAEMQNLFEAKEKQKKEKSKTVLIKFTLQYPKNKEKTYTEKFLNESKFLEWFKKNHTFAKLINHEILK